MPTLSVKDSGGSNVTINTLPAVGTAVIAAALPVSIASDQTVPVSIATVPTHAVTIVDISSAEYETVAASQSSQTIGGSGAIGDYMSGLLVIPATTSPGAVTLLDNVTSIPVFVGGASSVSNLVPFFIPLGMKSVSGAWKVTTGANVSVIAVGNFT